MFNKETNFVFKQTVVARAAKVTVLLLASAVSLAASAAVFDSDVDGLKLRWDNTLKYSTAYRLKSPSPTLTSDPNLDDGDQNFAARSIISNRVDIFSELDLEYSNVGLRVSGAGWYDQIYNQSNDNPGVPSAFPNQTSSAYNEFTPATRKLMGRKAEILDAFAYGRFNLGDTSSVVRVGRHGLVWGESLFFGGNGIAGAMAPIDIIKLIAVPGMQFKEVIRPVPQVSAQMQISPTVSAGAYYQFRWERNRLPAAGSYFSEADILDAGGEQLLLGPLGTAPRYADQTPKNSGQGGVQFRFQAADADFGLYAVHYHEKNPQVIARVGAIPGVGVVPVGYQLAFHEGITAFGASVSRTFGRANLAAEVSLRRNMDLSSTSGADASALGAPATNNTDNPAYAVGKTAHANVSMLLSPPPNALFNEATLLAEVAWNRVLSCQVNCAALDPLATRDAVALRLLFEPTYRQVLPGLDLGVPIGLGYAPKGSRSMALGAAGTPPENGGDFSIGLNGSYLDAWRVTLNYTKFFGEAKTFVTPAFHYNYGQPFKDRDFIAFSVRRAF